MAWIIGREKLGQTVRSDISQLSDFNASEWSILWYYRDGGIKRNWFIGQDNTPFSSVEFELNKKVCGAGTIKLNYIDFPVDAGDYVIVKYKGNNVYRALVENSGDKKESSIKLIPYHQRYSEILVAENFTNEFIVDMLEDVVNNTFADTGVSWNLNYIDISNPYQYSFDFSGYEKASKVIDELVNLLDNHYWGVNADNIFTVYKKDDDTSKIFLYDDDPAYTDLSVKDNYNKVDATRYQVFKKVGSGMTRIGQVGYDISYPTLSVEQVVRKKEDKYKVSQGVSNNDDALDLAYSDLKAQTAYRTIKVNDFDISKWFPEIGKKIKVSDKQEYILRDIINCESLTNDDSTSSDIGVWSNASLSDVRVSGLKSVTRVMQNNLDTIYYDIGNIVTFNNPIKIVFMIRADTAGNFLEFSIANNISGWSIGDWSDGEWSEDSASDLLFGSVKKININNSSKWQLVEFKLDRNSFRYFGIRCNQNLSSPVNLYIDRIQMYLIHQELYEGNLVKANIAIRNGGADCSLELGEYDEQANDRLFRLSRLTNRLETIVQN